MLRSALTVSSLLAACAASALAQSYTIQPMSLQPNRKPGGSFSLSLRMIGHAKVTFSGIGALDMGLGSNDASPAGVQARQYNDGYVGLDARVADDGTDIPSDGKTNTWSCRNPAQVADGGRAIAFHRYVAVADDTTVEAESDGLAGWDMEYAPCLGTLGKYYQNGDPAITWGVMAGLSLTSINAKTRQSIRTALHTTTDYYSLDGAVAPQAPYTAPSSTTASGTLGAIDTTTLLVEQPYRRTGWSPGENGTVVMDADYIVDDGALINGFWQVRGSYFTMRLGPWLRWKFTPRLAARASVGVTYSHVGLATRFDEILVKDDVPENSVRDARALSGQTYDLFGAYGAAEAELWLSSTTAVFVGVAHEQMSDTIRMALLGSNAKEGEEHIATVGMASSTGIRIGITKLF